MSEIQSLDQVYQIFRELFRDKLQEGVQFIEQKAGGYSNFLVETVNLIISLEYPDEFRIKVGIIFRSLIVDYWSTPSVQPQRKGCRESLLNGLVLNVGNMPVISCIVKNFIQLYKSYIIVTIIQLDPAHIWPNPLNELLNWMDDFNAVESGLELFLQLFEKMSENNGENSSLIKEVVPNLLEKGFSIFAQPELNENLREKILILVYQVFRSISYADGTDNHLVNKCLDSTFQIWMSLFLSALQTSAKSHIFIKKMVLKILIVIFRDFSSYSRKSLAISLLPIWKFFNSLSTLYIGHNVFGIEVDSLDQLYTINDSKKLTQAKKQQFNYQTSLEMRYLNEDDDYENHIEGLCAYSIELITILVTKPALYNLIKFGTFPLVNALANFITPTGTQERAWVRDPGYFIQNDEEELLQKSVRTLSLKLINDIIEKYGDQFIQQILLVGEKLILNRDDKEFLEMTAEIIQKLNFQELKGGQQKDFDYDAVMNFMKASMVSVSNTYYMRNFIEKRKEVGYLLLGNFSEDIISTFDIRKCMQNIIIELQRNESKRDNFDDIQLEYYNLQSRALWCTTRYSDLISFSFKDLLAPLLELSEPFVQSRYPLTLRLISAKACGNFASKIQKFQLLTSEQKQAIASQMCENGFVDNLLLLVQEVGEEQLYIVIEALISLIKFSQQFALSVAQKGSKILLQFFSVFHNEQFIIKVFNELISKICQYKDAYAYIFEIFCPFILDCFQVFYNELSLSEDKSKIKASDISLMSAIMSLTSTFVKYCQDQKAQETLITLFPSMVNLMLINEDSQLQVHTSQCLKNFIIIETGQILKMNLVQDVMKVNLKLLEVSPNSALETASLFAGNLVMITINNLLNGNPDLNLLKAIVFKIFRSRMPSTVQPLVLVYARMINQNAKECINFLKSWNIDNRMALKVLIDKWLLQQPLFRGRATKNATFSALKNLFLLKDKTLETLLVIGYNPSHQNINSDVYAPFKILSLLIRCLDNEIAPSQKDNQQANESERLEMEMDDEDGNEKASKQFNELHQETNQIDVDLEKFKDEEDQDIAERFKLIGHKDKGLADLETGSTLYMSEFLDFNQEVGEECDETTEEDLAYLQDPCQNINLIDMLKEFFCKLLEHDFEYFKFCLKNLLKEDIQLLNKHIKLKLT